MALLINEKTIVVPGEEIAEGMDFLPAKGTYRQNDKIIASQLGLVNVNGRLIRIIPLNGRYIPKAGDTVIGKVVNIGLNGWTIDIGYAYEANLTLKEGTTDFVERGEDYSKYYDFNDIVVAKLLNVNRAKFMDLTTKGPGLRKLRGGRIINVTPSKVPRVIGKQGSMITLVKEATQCRITVGQNGVVWIQGEPDQETKAVEAIRMIDEKAHIEGLTDEMKKFLEGKNGKK
jgi:exosome complex component RRP4|tara:strand:+ start:6906 stop:7595 length:690 start_codon:yes stop_codon:yes gene_type:complete